MLRWSFRRTRAGGAGDGQRRVFALGARIGYWPCLKAPFLQITLGRWHAEVWYGLPSLREVESGDL